MANEQNDNTRRPNPENAAQDADNAATQDQIRRDHDEMQRSADRVEASVPSEIRDRTVGEIVEDAERRADREGRGSGDAASGNARSDNARSGNGGSGNS